MDLRDNLEQLIDDFRLDPIKNYALDEARDVIVFPGGGEELYELVGNSRAGGEPDLPQGVSWPRMRNGKPMTFIAQINLQEASGEDRTGLLPVQGMLYFFFGDVQPYTQMEHHVVFCESCAELVRTAPPETPYFLTQNGQELFGEPAASFRGQILTAKSALNIPTRYYAQDFLRELEDSMEDEDRVEELYEDYDDLYHEVDGDWVCKIFGYGEDQHGDLEYEAALRIHADMEYNCYPDDALESLTAHFGNDAAKARKAVDDTLLLLEVQSDCRSGFTWGDAGVLHYFIDNDDLMARRFDRTYVSVYSA